MLSMDSWGLRLGSEALGGRYSGIGSAGFENLTAPAAVGTRDFEEPPLTVPLSPRHRPAVCSWVGFASRLFTSAEGPAYQRNEHVDKDPDGPAVPH